MEQKWKKLLYIGICTILSLFSCTTNSDKETKTKENDKIERVVKDENLEISDTAILIELTEKWNDLLVKQDLESLTDLYGDEVSTYGTINSVGQVIENKEKFFNKYADFNQSITGEIEVVKIDSKHYKVLFPKRTNYNSKSYDVEGVLVFQKTKDGWKIILESDSLTDKNLKEIKANINYELVEKILTTSPRFNEITEGLYEAIVANGGITYGFALVGGPNEEDNPWSQSETYDFKLYESYSDRIVTISWFTFDPNELQLYENGEPIEFDRDLLSN